VSISQPDSGRITSSEASARQSPARRRFEIGVRLLAGLAKKSPIGPLQLVELAPSQHANFDLQKQDLTRCSFDPSLAFANHQVDL